MQFTMIMRRNSRSRHALSFFVHVYSLSTQRAVPGNLLIVPRRFRFFFLFSEIGFRFTKIFYVSISVSIFSLI